MTNLTDPIFHDENKAREHLEAMRWPNSPWCPHCGSENVKRLEGRSYTSGALYCRECRKKFTVAVGTLFERSHIPLHKWVLAFHLMAASKKGMSAHQMHRMLDVTYKTAWFMAHRIREAMREPAGTGPLGGPNTVVEVDETFVGGKAKNRADGKVPSKEAVHGARRARWPCSILPCRRGQCQDAAPDPDQPARPQELSHDRRSDLLQQHGGTSSAGMAGSTTRLRSTFAAASGTPTPSRVTSPF
jgi:transposase-like protein